MEKEEKIFIEFYPYYPVEDREKLADYALLIKIIYISILIFLIITFYGEKYYLAYFSLDIL